jgi:hypothetical protein
MKELSGSSDCTVGGIHYWTIANLGHAASGMLPLGSQQNVLRAAAWKAPGWAASQDVIGDVALTTCDNGTGQCPSYAYGSPSIQGEGSVTKTRLVVNQLDAAGHVCATHYDPKPGHGSDGGNYKKHHIIKAVHHYKVFHRIGDLGFDTGHCGDSRKFEAHVEVNWASLNPFQVEDGPERSILIAMNRSAGETESYTDLDDPYGDDGTSDPPDPGEADDLGDEEEAGGCGVATGRPGTGLTLVVLAGLLALATPLRRSRLACGGLLASGRTAHARRESGSARGAFGRAPTRRPHPPRRQG